LDERLLLIADKSEIPVCRQAGKISPNCLRQLLLSTKRYTKLSILLKLCIKTFFFNIECCTEYHQVLLWEIKRQKIYIYIVNRPKKDKPLPEVLRLNEIKSIIESIKNIKHKCMIALAYSSGLRVSEVSKLKLKDIDFERKVIHIVYSKGRKDR